MITERRNSMITGTCARSVAGVPNAPIRATSYSTDLSGAEREILNALAY
ncbi:hypothetical protein [Streptomyces sp. NPDC001401]